MIFYTINIVSFCHFTHPFCFLTFRDTVLTAASCGHSFIVDQAGHTHGGTSLRNYQAHRQRQGFWLRRSFGRHRVLLPQLSSRRHPVRRAPRRSVRDLRKGSGSEGATGGKPASRVASQPLDRRHPSLPRGSHHTVRAASSPWCL